MSEEHESATDQNEPNDIEYPEECPSCGFEPVDPDIIEASGPDSLEDSDGPPENQFWEQSTSLNNDGTGSFKTICPECRHTVLDISIDEKMSNSMGFKGLKEND